MDYRRKKETVCIVIIITFLFAAVLAGTGSLFSGYHLVDDHEVIKTKLNLNESTVCNVVKSRISSDLAIRFRPLYQTLIVLKTWVLGTNMNLWMLVAMLEGIFANVFLYFHGRNQGLNSMESFVMAGIMLYGAQFAPWYRALNSENTPTMLLSLVFLLLSAGYRKGVHWDRKWWFRGMIMFLLTAVSMMKEAFCIALPAMIMYVFFLHTQKYRGGVFWECMKKNADYCMVLGTVCILEIYIIVCRVGMMPIEYAGIDTGMDLSGYLLSIKNSLLNEMKQFAVLSLAAFVILAVWGVKQMREGKLGVSLKNNMWLILFGTYGILSQFVLYARSQMWGRYILPFSLIWGTAILIPCMKILHGSQAVWKEKMRCRAAVTVWVTVLAAGLWGAFLGAREWAQSGEASNAALNELCSRASGKEGDILLHINDGELDEGAAVWLRYYADEYKDRIYFYPHAQPEQKFRYIVTSMDFYENDAGLYEIAGRRKEEYQTVSIQERYAVLYAETQDRY